MRSIGRVSITDEAVSQIRNEILSGRYRVGDRLATEYELAGTLGVGRSTIREALRMLAALGYIDVRQGRGAFVRKIDEDTDETLRDWFSRNRIRLVDFMEVRMSLEPLAVRLAIERADDEHIAGIGNTHETFERACASGDALGMASADEAFHTALARASRNELIAMIDRSIADSFRDYRVRSFAVVENARNALEPHRRILRALRARDAATAMREMVLHLEISLRDIDADAGAGAGG